MISTMKDYLTADMVEDPLSYLDQLRELGFRHDYVLPYLVPPYRPIYGIKQWPTLTYPYTIPYKDS